MKAEDDVTESQDSYRSQKHVLCHFNALSLLLYICQNRKLNVETCVELHAVNQKTHYIAGTAYGLQDTVWNHSDVVLHHIEPENNCIARKNVVRTLYEIMSVVHHSANLKTHYIAKDRMVARTL